MMSSLTILYGHRGVGKTSLLQRISRYIPEARCFCLDQEIEKIYGPISSLFSGEGEKAFRQKEKEVFARSLAEIRSESSPAFIAVGGGFDGDLPDSAQRLWIKRDWDVSKDLFLDRPSLNADPGDLRFPPDLFQQREDRFRHFAGEELTLPEGVYEDHPGERAYFSNQRVGGVTTLLPEHFERDRLPFLLRLQPQAVEIRDDLLNFQEIQRALEVVPSHQILLSFRNPQNVEATANWVHKAHRVDWPLDWGQIPFAVDMNKLILSHHSDEENFYEAFETVEGVERPIKWSPMVKSFLQLRLGHEWMLRSPGKRFFLPRSENGRWAWYRHWLKNKMELNFWRQGFGSALDQPTLLQWYQPTNTSFFAAVLGSPVLQSWSPAFHADFFAKRGMTFYAIEADEEELQEGGFEFLQRCGLVAAAVTSPLKNWAAQRTGSLRPINTLVLNSTKQWQGFSTDALGFAQTLRENDLQLADRTVVVWGGGGVLPSLALQNATAYSARQGRPREGHKPVEKAEVLIWCAGSQSPQMIPSLWTPNLVIDLNYRADSPAKLYAIQKKSRYISGQTMFVTQAREQQKIWSQYEWS